MTEEQRITHRAYYAGLKDAKSMITRDKEAADTIQGMMDEVTKSAKESSTEVSRQ